MRGSSEVCLFLDGRSQVGKDLQRLPGPASAQSRDQVRGLLSSSSGSQTPKDGCAGPTCLTVLAGNKTCA